MVTLFSIACKRVHNPYNKNEYMDLLVIPVWVPVLAIAPYPTLTFIRGPLRRWRRKRKGLCVKCEYDLTAC